MRMKPAKHRGLRFALVAGALTAISAYPVQAQTTPVPPGGPITTDSSYEPTNLDYQSVYDALQRYRMGVEMHDQQMQDSAFWEAPRRMAPPPGVTGGPGPGGPGGGPGGARPSMEELRRMPGFVEVWHMPLDSYIHFDSPTRARHFGYFISVYPNPENVVEGGGMPVNASAARNSTTGWPGYYDDILEKRNGEWRILTRNTVINQVRTSAQ